MEAAQFNWDIVWNIVILAVIIWQARWVWLDANAKYGRGPFWGLAALFLPGLGLIFYLLYRDSELMEIDMADAELEYNFQIADRVQVRRGSAHRPVRKESWLWRKTRLRHVSRRDKLDAKEIREKAAQVENEHPMLAKELREKADMLDPPRPPRKPFKQRWKEYWVIRRDLHEIRMKRWRERREYLKRPKKLRKYEEFAERLNKTPIVDPTMEGLIFEGQYEVARERAVINLQIAEESEDERKKITYRRYLDQIENITHRYFPDEVSKDEGIERLNLSNDEE
ncbi:hypothetical protein J7K50_05325 [bacterium]|nr:hypothetical protein [bacterium]